MPAHRACSGGFEPWKDARLVEWVVAWKSDNNLFIWIFCSQLELVFANRAVLGQEFTWKTRGSKI